MAAAMLVCGCSSFHRQWDAAVAQPLPAHDISGPWEGSWRSGKNNHRGRLRCVMTPAGTNLYQAHFHATFWKIFRAAYEVPLEVRREGGTFRFTGQSDLGLLGGGIYTYEGTATPAEFSSSYRSKHDHGRFEMRRP